MSLGASLITRNTTNIPMSIGSTATIAPVIVGCIPLTAVVTASRSPSNTLQESPPASTNGFAKEKQANIDTTISTRPSFFITKFPLYPICGTYPKQIASTTPAIKPSTAQYTKKSKKPILPPTQTNELSSYTQ